MSLSIGAALMVEPLAFWSPILPSNQSNEGNHRRPNADNSLRHRMSRIVDSIEPHFDPQKMKGSAHEACLRRCCRGPHPDGGTYRVGTLSAATTTDSASSAHSLYSGGGRMSDCSATDSSPTADSRDSSDPSHPRRLVIHRRSETERFRHERARSVTVAAVGFDWHRWSLGGGRELLGGRIPAAASTQHELH